MLTHSRSMHGVLTNMKVISNTIARNIVIYLNLFFPFGHPISKEHTAMAMIM